MNARTVIEVRNLRKVYDQTVAVDDLSFEVLEGEVFGLLGPNGAGKTTTMECVEGVRKSDGGSVSVLSLDPQRDAIELQNRIGVQLQQAQLQKRIKVREAVDLWAALYPKTVNGDELLEQLGLAEKRESWFMTLSGGQKQRLFIALALINDPDLVFLDELTTGLDPQARHAIWDLVRGIKDKGKTVFLTTHLMEEAERLCDRVAIIEHGKIIAMGTPEGLVREHCPERKVLLVSDRQDLRGVLENIPHLQSIHANDAQDSPTPEVITWALEGRGDDFFSEVIHCLSEHSIRVKDFRTVTPTLEDVFLQLTGRSIRD